MKNYLDSLFRSIIFGIGSSLHQSGVSSASMAKLALRIVRRISGSTLKVRLLSTTYVEHKDFDLVTGTIERLGFPPDLYYLHRIDPDTPLEESIPALDALRKEGKTKYIGLSECSAKTLRRANESKDPYNLPTSFISDGRWKCEGRYMLIYHSCAHRCSAS
jgi:hypothetical protein